MTIKNTVEEKTLLERKSLKEEIFEVLHERIIAGKISPGEWLRQEEISSQLGVSQTPVREALDLLVSSGLAERIPYRGVRVLQLSVEEIIDAHVMRLLLESKAAIAAAQNRTPAQLTKLLELIHASEDLMSLNDMPRQMQLNREFHRTIVEASGNSLLSRLYEMVSHQFPDWMLYEYMYRHPDLLRPSLSQEFLEHKAIAEAIKAQDSVQAERYVLIHIHNLGNELVNFLEIPLELMKKKVLQINPAAY